MKNILKKLTAAMLALALTLIPLALAEGDEIPDEEGALRGVCPEEETPRDEAPEFVNAILPVEPEETEEAEEPAQPEEEEEPTEEIEEEDEYVPTIDETFHKRIDLTDQIAPEEPEEEEEETEEDELDMALREIMEQRVDLTDQPGSSTGLEKTELEDIMRMLLGYTVPVGFTIDTIHKCQTGRYTSDQKLVKVTVALTLDVIKSALPTGAAGYVNTNAQDYIDKLIRNGQFKGGSKNNNVECVLAVVEHTVGSLSADSANLVRDLYGAVAILLG